MAREHRRVRHDDMFAEHAVVGNVRESHEKQSRPITVRPPPGPRCKTAYSRTWSCHRSHRSTAHCRNLRSWAHGRRPRRGGYAVLPIRAPSAISAFRRRCCRRRSPLFFNDREGPIETSCRGWPSGSPRHGINGNVHERSVHCGGGPGWESVVRRSRQAPPAVPHCGERSTRGARPRHEVPSTKARPFIWQTLLFRLTIVSSKRAVPRRTGSGI